MSARRKLNALFGGGLLMMAAVVGGLFQSWLVFWGLLIVLGLVSLNTGLLRLAPASAANRPMESRRSVRRS